MSLFSKDPSEKPPVSPYAAERIEHEIAHLRKGSSVRDPKQARRSLAAWLLVLFVLGLLWLFFMDPILHGFKRGEAIRTYLYLHGFGSEQKARALLATGIFTEPEIEQLNRRQGAFQDYFSSPAAAERKSDAIVDYLNGVTNLHASRYEKLDPVGKIRYQLFVRWGLMPPTDWSAFDPSIGS
jgi:hypothetical protein